MKRKARARELTPEYRQDTIDLSLAFDRPKPVGILNPLGNGRNSGRFLFPKSTRSIGRITPVIKPVSEEFNLSGVKTAFVIPRIIEAGETVFVMIEDFDKKAYDGISLRLKFPGGGLEGSDEDEISGAFREMVEEIDDRKIVRKTLDRGKVEVVGRLDLPSNQTGVHSVGVFSVEIPVSLKQSLKFGEEQSAMYFVSAEDIEEAVETNQILPQHALAWELYKNFIVGRSDSE